MKESLPLSTNEIARQLVELMGRKLTTYVGNVRDVRAVDRWIDGREIYGDGEQRLRFALQIVKTLAEREHLRVVRAWLISLNPELGDRVPIRLMRQCDLEKVAVEIMGQLEFSLSVDRDKEVEDRHEVSELIERLSEFGQEADVFVQFGSRSFAHPIWIGIMDTAELFGEEKNFQLVISPWEPEDYLKPERGIPRQRSSK